MRLLFVHAHPDDETLATGLTMASAVSRGHDVHVLTCTLGEEGEVIPPELAYLAADRTDALGPWRREELRAAMAVLGVQHRVLGEDPGNGLRSRYRDSGMAGTLSADEPDAFVRADPGEAAALVAAAVAEVSPDLVVTYDEHGGYGHPDHIQTHRVTLAALLLLEPSARPACFAVLTPRSWAEQDRRWVAGHVDPADSGLTLPPVDGDYAPSIVDDAVVTHEIVDPGSLASQARALREHRTQVIVHDGYYALSNRIATRLAGREGFAGVDPASGRLLAAHGGARHTGLFPGVA